MYLLKSSRIVVIPHNRDTDIQAMITINRLIADFDEKYRTGISQLDQRQRGAGLGRVGVDCRGVVGPADDQAQGDAPVEVPPTKWNRSQRRVSGPNRSL